MNFTSERGMVLYGLQKLRRAQRLYEKAGHDSTVGGMVALTTAVFEGYMDVFFPKVSVSVFYPIFLALCATALFLLSWRARRKAKLIGFARKNMVLMLKARNYGSAMEQHSDQAMAALNRLQKGE